MDIELTDEEYELLERIAEAFSVREPAKPDHPLTPMLVRKGVIRTNGSCVMITEIGVATLRARGHRGPLPISRAERLTPRQRKPRPNPRGRPSATQSASGFSDRLYEGCVSNVGRRTYGCPIPVHAHLTGTSPAENTR